METLKEFLYLRSGEEVVDRPHSNLTKDVRGYLDEAVQKIDSDGRQFIEAELCLHRDLGESIVVETKSSDNIFFAKRLKPNGCIPWGHSRFVRNRQSTKTQFLTIVLMRDKENKEKYIIITAYIGRRAQPEPWDKRAFAKKPNPHAARQASFDFWSNHAFVADETPFLRDTVCSHPPSNKRKSMRG